MQDGLDQLLNRYQPGTMAQTVQALREVIQEIALVGLWRAKFFDHAAFYGGTALRIFYQLNRFSEDLDFSLLSPNSDFSLEPYNKSIVKELESFGFRVTVETKIKAVDSNIESAFIKANTQAELLNIGFTDPGIRGIPKDAKIKIKLEVDITPPPLFDTEIKILNNPLPISVRCYKPPFLFAGKMHAILCRLWKNRVKGRDWYDLVWFISKNIPLNLPHLESRLHQNGFLLANEKLDIIKFINMLDNKIASCDFDKAKQDITPFIRDVSILECWNKEYFNEATKKIFFE